MKAGDKVVCIKDRNWVCASRGIESTFGPRYGDQVTIKSITPGPSFIGLILEEYPNSPFDFYIIPRFNIKFFRPIDYAYGESVAAILESELSVLQEVNI